VQREASIFLFQSTFFGLTPDYRIYLFSQIHDIVFHGKGGYDWDTIYNMPIWLRRFTFEKIKEFYDKEREEAEKHNSMLKNNNNSSKGEINRPNVSPPSSAKKPTYTVKAPKK